MKIGTVEIDSRLALAPMAGVTDLAFRQICRELGAGYSVTELVSAKALCYQDKKSRTLLKLAPNEVPAAAQIFGSDPYHLFIDLVGVVFGKGRLSADGIQFHQTLCGCRHSSKLGNKTG